MTNTFFDEFKNTTNSLKKLTSDKIYLEEYKFRQWLPVFLNYFNQSKEDGKINLWVTHVAMNPYNEVIVVDKIGKDQTELFVVPSILRKDAKVYSDEFSNGLTKFIDEANVRDAAYPGSIDRVLKNELTDELLPNMPVDDYDTKWAKIYQFYKLEPSGDVGGFQETEEDFITGFSDDF